MINKREFVELTVNTVAQSLSCSISCLVVEFSHGHSTDNTTSNLSMTIVPSTSQYMKDYNYYFINQVEFGVDTAYMIVMTPYSGRSNVPIDFVLVSVNTG